MDRYLHTYSCYDTEGGWRYVHCAMHMLDIDRASVSVAYPGKLWGLDPIKYVGGVKVCFDPR